MGVKKVLRREEIIKFITRLYDGDLHAKRVLSLANATLGVLSSASLAVHAMGQGLAQASKSSECTGRGEGLGLIEQ